MYFLGVENGLARTRGVVLNLDSASIEAGAEVGHEFVGDLPSTHREQDPSQWVRAVDQVARAGLEALLLELSSGLERMREIGVKPETIRLTGGGLADAEVRRLVADVMGVAVLPLRGEVSPAMGAALQVAWTFFHQSGEELTFEEITSYAVAPEEGQRCEPNQARFKFYQDLLKRQEALVETVQGEQCAKGGHG